MGWLMMRKHPEVIRKGKTLDVSDLLRDPALVWQRKYVLNCFSCKKRFI